LWPATPAGRWVKAGHQELPASQAECAGYFVDDLQAHAGVLFLDAPDAGQRHASAFVELVDVFLAVLFDHERANGRPQHRAAVDVIGHKALSMSRHVSLSLDFERTGKDFPYAVDFVSRKR
jgi:hypothetical protein